MDRTRMAAIPSSRTAASVPPLFERIIYYGYLPELFSRIFLEAGLGIYWYSITSPKQWVFYLLMMGEYAYQITTIHKARFVLGSRLIPALLTFVMFLHGAAIGLASGNQLGKLVSDSVPVLVVCVNIILFSRIDAFGTPSLARISRVSNLYGLLMVVVGFVAIRLGKPSVVSLGSLVGTASCISVILVNLNQKPVLRWYDLGAALLIIGMIAPNMNRTTLLVVLLGFVIMVAPRFLRRGLSAYGLVVACLLGIAAIPVVLPEDSPIVRRIEGIFVYDASATTGSIGERQAEWLAINETLSRRGPEAVLFGLGAGGTYDVVYSDGHIPENYSHAHFGWALFKLRYGLFGFIYLGLFVGCLVLAVGKNLREGSPQGLISALLGVFGLVSVGTYMYYNQLASGLQLVWRDPLQRASLASAGMPRERRDGAGLHRRY